MGLLAPLFLAGLLAVALPLWLHRLQTQSSERRPFGSAMLLEHTEERIHVKRELKYLLLLGFRILLLVLLALAFAKPLIERPPAGAADASAGSDLVVVDASLSMGRSGVMQQARSEARRVIDEADEGATIAVLGGGVRIAELLPASADKAAQQAAVAALDASPARVDFGALMRAAAARAETLPPPVRLHLVSDFQASAMPAQFADVVPANVQRLITYPVGTGDPVNWTVTGLRQTADGIEVSVANHGLPDRVADVELYVNDTEQGVRTTTGQGSYTVAFEGVEFEPGDNRIEVQLVTDDDIAADNTAFGVVRNDPPAPVPLITRAPGALPATYIAAALEASSEQKFEVETLVPGDFDTRVLSRHSWVIVDDIGLVDPGLADALGTYLENGGNLLAFAGDGTRSQPSLPVSGRELAAADLGSGTTPFRRIATVDDLHPALADTLGWSELRVSQSVALGDTDDLDVLATLDNGAPFIVEERHDAGRLLLVLSAADNQWNDLPVHAVFVSFMLEAADYLSGRVAEFGAYTVGDALSLRQGGAGQVVDPDGESLLSLAATADVTTIRLEKPGIYAVYTAEDESLVAANVDPRESEITPVSPATLERWQAAAQSERAAPGTIAAAATEGDPLELWPWLLLLLAIVVVAESALGNLEFGTRIRATT